jgi:hypothetical protein
VTCRRPGRRSGRSVPAKGARPEALHGVLDAAQAGGGAVERRSGRIAERLVGFDEMTKDPFEIPIAGP